MAAPTSSSAPGDRPAATGTGTGTGTDTGTGTGTDTGTGDGAAQESAFDTSAPSGPDYVPSVIPHDRLAGCVAAHRRLTELARRLDDTALRRPSGLPGWTVGHLLAHLARNADSHTGMVEAALAGEVRDQYPGGEAQRDEGIAVGRDAAAGPLRADLTAAVTRLERAWDTLSIGVWRTGLGRTETYGLTTLADLLFLRWREVEVHLVDLDLADLGGPGWDDLSPAYVEAEWDWTLRELPDRVPAEVTVVLAPGDRPSSAVGHGPRPVLIDASTRQTLRWLTGRWPGQADWPELAAWS